MFKQLGMWTLFSVCGMIACSSVLALQESVDLVIVNQDGEQVQGLKAPQGVQVKSGANFKIEGDKIVIIDSEGKTQEIDISGAKSVSVQQSVNTVNDNGNSQTVTRGKAVIIGPDGERREIELGGPLEMGDGHGMMMFDDGGKIREMLQNMPRFQFQDDLALPRAFSAQFAAAGKYMIGVNCEPVPDSLRAHLDLEPGVGLIVQSVSEETPAAEAGIKQHDVLVFAEDKQLSDNEALVKAVQVAGEEGAELTLIGLRGGKEIQFKVKPVERPANQLQWRGNLGGPMKFEMNNLGPGLILDGNGKSFREDFDAMRQELLELRRDLMKMRDDRQGDDDNDN